MKQFIDKLIERLEEIEEHCLDMHDWQGQSAIVEAKEIINQLAEEHKDDIQTIDVSELLGESVNDGWIPCSERLPDDFMSMEYLTTVKGRFYSEINYYCVVNHKWYSNERTTKEVNVIAWMPKPTVYQPKGQAND